MDRNLLYGAFTAENDKETGEWRIWKIGVDGELRELGGEDQEDCGNMRATIRE